MEKNKECATKDHRCCCIQSAPASSYCRLQQKTNIHYLLAWMLREKTRFRFQFDLRPLLLRFYKERSKQITSDHSLSIDGIIFGWTLAKRNEGGHDTSWCWGSLFSSKTTEGRWWKGKCSNGRTCSDLIFSSVDPFLAVSVDGSNDIFSLDRIDLSFQIVDRAECVVSNTDVP